MPAVPAPASPPAGRTRWRWVIGAGVLLLVAVVVAGVVASSGAHGFTEEVADGAGDAPKPGLDIRSASVRYSPDGTLAYVIRTAAPVDTTRGASASVALPDKGCKRNFRLYAVAPLTNAGGGVGYVITGDGRDAHALPTVPGTATISGNTLTGKVQDAAFRDLEPDCFVASITNAENGESFDDTVVAPSS
jgi:hypothetical protein